MTSSAADVWVPQAVAVSMDDDTLTVDLSDGRSLAVPHGRHPRLVHASAGERANCRLIGNGEGIHWPDMDEDISVAALLAGRPPAESRASLQRWLTTRQQGLAEPS
jgi:hypothetical protein